MKQKINLVFQGGGIKGLAYVGVLRYLEENDFEVDYVSGTSVGAIISSLIAVGYDSFELEKILNELPIEVLLPSNEESSVFHKLKNKGLYSQKSLEEYLEKLYLQKNKRVMGDLKVGNYYKAIFITTSIKMRRIFVLPYDLRMIGINPDAFPIAKAVCMSACLPIVYEPYVINGYKFIDGGASDNCPHWCFDKAFVLRFGQEGAAMNFFKKQIFGKISNDNEQTIINIDVKEYKTTDFKKGMKERYILYNRGYDAIKKHFEPTQQNNT